MKKLVCLILAMLLALATLTPALAVDKDAVKAAQQALNDAGYDCGTPDGVAGKKTAAAVAAYQEANGLEVTGEIDDALLRAMGISAVWLYDPKQFSTAWWDRFIEVCNNTDWGPGYDQEEIISRITQLYRPDLTMEVYEMDGSFTFIPVISFGRGGRFEIYIGYARIDGAFVRPNGLSFFIEKVEGQNLLDAVTSTALQQFVLTAVDTYGGTEEDIAQIDALLRENETEDGYIDLDEFDEGWFFSADNYSLAFWDRDDSFDFSFEATIQEEGVSLSEDDVPALPEALAAQIGDIPQTVDELTRQFDCAWLEGLYDAYPPLRLLDELMNSGGFTIDDAFPEEYGLSYIAFSYTDINGDTHSDYYAAEEEQINVTLEGKQITATLEEELPNIRYLSGCSFDLVMYNTSNAGSVEMWAGRSLDGSGEESDTIKAVRWYELDREKTYTVANASIDYDGGKWTLSIWLSTPQTNYCWEIVYDETGNIASKRYDESPNI